MFLLVILLFMSADVQGKRIKSCSVWIINHVWCSHFSFTRTI